MPGTHASRSSPQEDSIKRAADAIRNAAALLIGAGAGMGVDSGLPDFRGPEGFWRAYPVFRQLNRRFEEMSNPSWFRHDPAQAWGFFGHRLNLYRTVEPHAGFAVLKRFAARCKAGYFVFTSNVDGQFQKAGFDDERVVECHGSIHHLQCVKKCCANIWSAESVNVQVDEQRIVADGELPKCESCRGLARPNILMFGDSSWIATRTMQQHQRYAAWLRSIREQSVVAIELGAGLAIPTVRHECETRADVVIRINPRDPQGRPSDISIPFPAVEALRRIEEAMQLQGAL